MFYEIDSRISYLGSGTQLIILGSYPDHNGFFWSVMQITVYKLKFTGYKLKFTSWSLQVTSWVSQWKNYVVSLHADCHYAQCHYAKFHFPECH